MDATPPVLTRRKLLVGGAALAGTAALSACGARLAATEDTGGPPQGDITLLTPIFPGADGKALLEKKLLPTFLARYPQVTVTVDYTTYDYLNQKITTGLTTGIPADVVMLGVGWVEPFASRQILSELQVPPGGLSGYSDSLLRSCRYGGKLYALPAVLDTRFGIARRDILAQNGYSRPPTSMAELREYAIRLTQRDPNGKLLRAGLDVQSLDPRQLFETILFAFGGDLFRDGKPAFNDPTGVAALQWLTDLQLKDKVIDQGFSNPKATTLPIADGRAALAVGHNNWWVTTTKQRPGVIGLLQPFLLQPDKPSIFAGGTLVSVSAASRHQSAAQALAQFMASPDVSLAGAAQKGNVPALAQLEQSAYVRDPKHALVRFGLENLRYGRGEGGIPAWLPLRDELFATVQAATTGRQDPKAALDSLAVTANAAIADFGSSS
jgi:multiple sugar transport system substrate-binding protein